MERKKTRKEKIAAHLKVLNNKKATDAKLSWKGWIIFLIVFSLIIYSLILGDETIISLFTLAKISVITAFVLFALLEVSKSHWS